MTFQVHSMTMTMTIDDPSLIAAVLRTDLASFVHKTADTLAPRAHFHPGWHIDAAAYQLTRCLEGQNRRLLITQPPRTLKSIAASVAFIAWSVGGNPSLRFICVSYSQELAADLHRQFRRVVESPWYKDLFPMVHWRRMTDSECLTASGGGRIATSVGGTLTGRGADVIVIDDPLKAEEAVSVVARSCLLDWYRGTLLSRLNDPGTGVMIAVMQRLHEEDLAGHLIEQGGWHHLDLPAIAVAEERIPIGNGRFHHRREGDLLHPERLSRPTLDELKVEMGSLAFSAQSQQRPIPLEGNLIKREWLKSYEHWPETGEYRQIVQSWDIATSISGSADYSVCTTWLIWSNHYYLLDVWRGRIDFPSVRRQVGVLAQRHGAGTVLIEEAGLGQCLRQDLVDNPLPGLPCPTGIKPVGDKAMRLATASAKIEAGQVLIPADAPWLADFLRELLAFPGGRHDDQVDSLSQFINWQARQGAGVQSGAPSADAAGSLFECDEESGTVLENGEPVDDWDDHPY